MIHAKKIVMLLACGALLLAGTGCDDQKNELTQLRQSNQQLLDELQSCREDLASCREANDSCQNEVSRLRSDLARANSQPPPVEVRQEVPTGWTPVPGGAMIALESEVLFDSGKVQIKDGAKRSLEQVLGPLRGQYSDKRVFVIGHTDDQPIRKSGWQDNYQLSTERGLAVVRWLKERGINPERLTACGCGEYRPKVPNTSAQSRKSNRRVEIYALDAEIRPAAS